MVDNIYYTLLMFVLIFILGCNPKNSTTSSLPSEESEKVKKDEKEITTSSLPSFIDKRDGNQYAIKTYGEQTWMIENLRYDTLAYRSIDSMKSIYGNYYNWEDACEVCPSGWHLPTDEDWLVLEKTVGVPELELREEGHRGEGIGLKMRSPSGWRFDNNGTNELGFNAEPASSYSLEGDKVSFLVRQVATFWTATASTENAEKAWYRAFNHYDTKIERKTTFKRFMYPVRCVKDE